MRKLYYLGLFFLILAFSGCVTAEKNAYRTLGTVSTLADQSMTAWGDYVKKGNATPAEELKVRAAYTSYQKSMVAAKLAVYAYRASKKENPDELTAAVNAVNASVLEVVKVVQEILKK